MVTTTVQIKSSHGIGNYVANSSNHSKAPPQDWSTLTKSATASGRSYTCPSANDHFWIGSDVSQTWTLEFERDGIVVSHYSKTLDAQQVVHFNMKRYCNFPKGPPIYIEQLHKFNTRNRARGSYIPK